ncbi:hypothetical protein [Achromobacter xylosoxidans]|uniref:hypothetical protein n=1 Tax=Alcaligenes xylosoxydans xylosoxydans TaxID=85698 RepID=UPI0015C5C98E|nr:hypothetical protein [Achromobacter xylosoxidans]
MSLILLTDIDGNALAINPDFIVSVTAVLNSYHGSRAVIHTQNGKSHTVRQAPEEIFDAIQHCIQGER